jgi:hypothetical protein
MVFKSVRNSLSGSIATWAFSDRANHVTQDHPAYIPHDLNCLLARLSGLPDPFRTVRAVADQVVTVGPGGPSPLETGAWGTLALVVVTASGPAPAWGPRSCPAQAPPPNPTAAERDGRRVLSRVGVADHEVTPKALWTGSGWREYSYGGFGGGHPRFHRHADCRHPKSCRPGLSAWDSVPSELSWGLPVMDNWPGVGVFWDGEGPGC